MKTAIVPFFTGQEFPDRSIWLPLPAKEVETMLADFARDRTRAWHTVSLHIYDQVGCGCFVKYTWLSTDAQQKELEEFLRDRCTYLEKKR